MENNNQPSGNINQEALKAYLKDHSAYREVNMEHLSREFEQDWRHAELIQSLKVEYGSEIESVPGDINRFFEDDPAHAVFTGHELNHK